MPKAHLSVLLVLSLALAANALCYDDTRTIDKTLTYVQSIQAKAQNALWYSKWLPLEIQVQSWGLQHVSRCLTLFGCETGEYNLLLFKVRLPVRCESLLDFLRLKNHQIDTFLRWYLSAEQYRRWKTMMMIVETERFVRKWVAKAVDVMKVFVLILQCLQNHCCRV